MKSKPQARHPKPGCPRDSPRQAKVAGFSVSAPSHVFPSGRQQRRNGKPFVVRTTRKWPHVRNPHFLTAALAVPYFHDGDYGPCGLEAYRFTTIFALVSFLAHLSPSFLSRIVPRLHVSPLCLHFGFDQLPISCRRIRPPPRRPFPPHPCPPFRVPPRRHRIQVRPSAQNRIS